MCRSLYQGWYSAGSRPNPEEAGLFSMLGGTFFFLLAAFGVMDMDTDMFGHDFMFMCYFML